MVKYWYCANIPPRSLKDEARKEKKLDQSEAEKKKNVVVWKQKNCHKLLEAGGGWIRKTVGVWEVNSNGVGDESVMTVGSDDREETL